MRYCILAILFLIPCISYSQVKDSTKVGTVAGIIKDSVNGFPLQSVTITVYKKADSALLDFQLSNNAGEFSFPSLPLATPLIFSFSYVGFKSNSALVNIDTISRKYDLKNILLSRGHEMLEGVVVEAVVPIRMNGDTLEINPAAFKLDENAVVEDMLRRVPGVTMWGDGTITVNGKKVNNVYVDGKKFFSGDPAIATQNLPKNAIEKVQVYQEIDYSKDKIDELPTDSLLTMNIKLKADKRKGFFGKVGAGIGTDNRYEADASIQAFNKKDRIGIAGALNNINKNADQESIFSQGTFRNFNPSNRYVANFGGSGVNKIRYFGANYQHDFSEMNNSRFNNQFTAKYDLKQTINDVITNTNSQNSASGTVFLNESNRESHSNTTSNTLNAGYEKRDRIRNFSINANYTNTLSESDSKNTTSSEKEGIGLVSKSNDISNSESRGNSWKLNTRFGNRDDDERNLKSYNLNYSFSYNDNESTRNTVSDFNSVLDPSKSKSYDRLYNTNSNGLSNSLNFSYNSLKRLLFGGYNLWDINIGFINNLSISNSKRTSLVSDVDTITGKYIENTYLTNNNDVNRVDERPSLRFTKNFRRNLSNRFSRFFNITANLQAQFLNEKNSSNIANRNLNRSFQFLIPDLNFNYSYKKFNKYNLEIKLGQNSSVSIPTVDQLYPIIDSTSLYSFNYGNANLKPSHTNTLNFNLDYNTENRQRKSDINFGFNTSVGQINDAIVDSSNYDNLGRRNIYLININGQKFINSGFNINTSIKLKKDLLQFGYNTNYSTNVSPNYIDGIYSRSNSQSFNNSLRLFYSVGEIATFQVSQSLNISASKQTGKNLTSFNNRTHITQASINLKYPKDFTFSNTFNYVNNKSANQSAALWNAFLTFRFLKSKQAEIKLSAMDILRQNKNISVSAGPNSMTTTVTNGLQQFYMITLSYFPRQFGGRGGRGGMQMGPPNRGGENRNFREGRNWDGGGGGRMNRRG